MNQDTTDALRKSPYPRALVYPENTYFGVVKDWWWFMAMTALLMYMLVILFRLAWWVIPPVLLIELIVGFMSTRWDVHHIKIYKQYSQQANVYEPGFFISQKINRRPEGVGREYPG